MAFNPMTSGSPFDGFFQKNLPAFFFDKFKGADLDRIEALFANLEITFDNMYQKLRVFPDLLDVHEAEAKYLYQLGGLLGVTSIDNDGDLSDYLDDDGNVDTTRISQADFDAALSQQRMYIATAIPRYLLKGTVESINRLLYAKGYVTNIQELWAEDVINGPFFEYNNALVTKYGDPIFGDVNGDVYSDTTFDLVSEIQADVVTASVSAVEVWEQNNYGYQYVISNSNFNDLYFKTNTEPISGDASTWYEFGTTSFPLSGNIDNIKILNDKVYITTDLNNLIVYPYDLTDPDLSEDFKIDDGDCYKFDFIENGTRIILDRGNNIEVRDSSTYQKISAAVGKPTGYPDTMDHVIRKKDGEYVIINDLYMAYILSINTVSYDLYGSPNIYNLLVDPLEDKHEVFSDQDDEITLLKYNSTTNEFLASYIFFDESYTMGIASSPITSAGAFTEVNDMFHYDDKVIILGNTVFGIYDVPARSMDVYYAYITTGYDYQKVSFLDKFYFQRVTSGITDFAKINSWNSFLNALYKSHYFDIEVQVNVDSPSVTDITSAINLVLPLAKPIHTELQNITTILVDLEALFAENIAENDDATTLPTTAGGSQYTIGITASYDGIHPWKRSNATILTYMNDGIDGRPLLYYRETTFDFDVDTTNDELDAIIYTNTPEP